MTTQSWSTSTKPEIITSVLGYPLSEWPGKVVQLTSAIETYYSEEHFTKPTPVWLVLLATPSANTLSTVTTLLTLPSSSPLTTGPPKTIKPTSASTEPKPSPTPNNSSPSQRTSDNPTITPTEGPPVSLTPTSTASSTPSPANRPQSASLSNGAIVGIAIGCVIAGLIIGALAALCLFRRRQDKHSRPEYLPMQYSSGEKVLPLAPASDKLQLDQFLLDPKPDADIAAELKSLGQLIQQHVENNYHLQPVQRSPNALAQTLVQLGLYEQDSSAATTLASLAIDPRTRWAALQHVISRVTFASTSLDGHSPISLLPPFAEAFVQSLPPIESHRGSSEAVKVAMTRWRQLSAFLLHPNRSERTPLMPSEDVSTHQAQQLAVALTRFLETFVSGDRELRYEQENHLREVIVECAVFGYLLFSQPSEFRFLYNDESKSNGIVTCPGLDKIGDEEGRLIYTNPDEHKGLIARYAKPYTLVAPVVEGTYVNRG